MILHSILVTSSASLSSYSTIQQTISQIHLHHNSIQFGVSWTQEHTTYQKTNPMSDRQLDTWFDAMDAADTEVARNCGWLSTSLYYGSLSYRFQEGGWPAKDLGS